jgi:hypothetical protein
MFMNCSAAIGIVQSFNGGICFVESIPWTVSGKMQRGKLAGMNDRRDAGWVVGEAEG